MNVRPRFDHVQQSVGDMKCGPACVAIVSGTTLQQGVEATKFYKDQQDLGTWYHNIRGALAALGMTYETVHRTTKSWDRIKGVAIVACDAGSSGNANHWVVFDSFDGLVYDPSRAKPEPYWDCSDLRPTSHMQVWTWNTPVANDE